MCGLGAWETVTGAGPGRVSPAARSWPPRNSARMPDASPSSPDGHRGPAEPLAPSPVPLGWQDQASRTPGFCASLGGGSRLLPRQEELRSSPTHAPAPMQALFPPHSPPSAPQPRGDGRGRRAPAKPPAAAGRSAMRGQEQRGGSKARPRPFLPFGSKKTSRAGGGMEVKAVFPLRAAAAVAASRPPGTMRQSCAAAAALPAPLPKGQTQLAEGPEPPAARVRAGEARPGLPARGDGPAPGCSGQRQLPTAGRGSRQPETERGTRSAELRAALGALGSLGRQLAAPARSSGTAASGGDEQLPPLGWLPAAGSGSGWTSVGWGCPAPVWAARVEGSALSPAAWAWWDGSDLGCTSCSKPALGCSRSQLTRGPSASPAGPAPALSSPAPTCAWLHLAALNP